MSYSINLGWRGLSIYATIDQYSPGDRMEPPSGGCVEDFTWTVDDIDEVLLECELSEGMDRMIRGFYHMFKRLPDTLIARINDWDFDEEIGEYFWSEVGGPSGYEDHCYEG